MDGVTELAKKIKGLESVPYSPMIGTIISLQELKIQLGNRAQLEADDISAAAYQGYSAAEIDELLANGFTPEEIEEFIYCCE